MSPDYVLNRNTVSPHFYCHSSHFPATSVLSLLQGRGRCRQMDTHTHTHVPSGPGELQGDAPVSHLIIYVMVSL